MKKTVLDDWGDAIENIPDEGVFDETSLGADVIDFPNTNEKRFPYAPTPDKKIKRVAANKFGLYADDDPQYNGGSMQGMGDDWIITGQKEGYVGKTGGGVSVDTVTGAVTDGIGAAFGLTTGILDTIQSWRSSEQDRQQQSDIFNLRLREADAAIAAAQQPITERIGVGLPSGVSRAPGWMWLAGGLGVVVVGGIVYYLVKKA